VLADAAPARPEVLAREDSARQEARSLPAPPAAAPMAAPAPPPPAAAPSIGAAAQPPAAMRAAPVPAFRWTQVRIEADGKSVVVPLDQAGRLPALINRLLAAEGEPAVFTPGTLRLELAEGNELAGMLELVGERWRWTPLRDTQPARMLKADPALSRALREDAERLLR
jgi:hypothetical protein